MGDILDTVGLTINTYKMIENKDHIVIGVSGGADSICLLHILYRLQEKYDLTLHTVHIHHGLRGEEADQDAAFVKKICHQYQIPYEGYYFDIAKEAEIRKMAEEEAGRIIRYQVFADAMAAVKAQKVAVAHTMNDQAETLLMRICRGTGVKGLGGIPPVRGAIIRPLIECTREQIEKYCEKQHLSYRIDSTNQLDIYTRNKIRLHLIPWIQKELNPNIIQTLGKTSILLQQEDQYIEEQSEEAFYKCLHLQEEGFVELNIEKLCQNTPVIVRRILRQAVLTVRGHVKDLTYGHVISLEELLTKQTGKQVYLPGEMVAEKQYDLLRISVKSFEIKFCYDIVIGQRIYIPEIQKYVAARLLPKEDYGGSVQNVYTKRFDYDKIKDSLQIRSRQAGDKIQTKGMTGTKKLKKYFIDEKIPRLARDRIPLVVEGNNIIWIVGQVISEAYKIEQNTKTILEISVESIL